MYFFDFAARMPLSSAPMIVRVAFLSVLGCVVQSIKKTMGLCLVLAFSFAWVASAAADVWNPTVDISTSASSPTNADVVTINVTFSEPVIGFEASDITPTNATLSGFSGSGADYSFDLVIVDGMQSTIEIEAEVAVDDFGMPNVHSTQTLRIRRDATRPTIALSTSASSPTNSASVPVTVTFSEPVLGFDASDLQITNGSISNFSWNGLVANFDLALADGATAGVSIAENIASDQATNGNEATTSTLNITRDSSAPELSSVSIVSNNTNATRAKAGEVITLSFTTNEALQGTPSVTLNGTAASVSGSGSSFSATRTVSGSSPTGLVSFNIAGVQDAAGNVANEISATSDGTSVTIDTNAPSPVISADISSISQSAPQPFTATITFNETVEGFSIADLTASNASLSNISPASGTSSTFTATVTPNGSSDVVLGVAASVAQDLAGNGNVAASALSVPLDDDIAPTASISTSAGALTNQSSVPVTVTFSEAVSGFTASDVTVGNGSVSNFTGSGDSYSFDLNIDEGRTATANIAANIAQDASSNGNEAAPETVSVARDSTGPSVSISTTAGASTSLSSVPVTVTFTEDVIGFTQSDLTVTNGSISNFSGSGRNYTFDLNIADGATATATVLANIAEDAASNGNSAAPENVSVSRDSTMPSASISTTAPAITSSASAPVTVIFSEAVTGFTASDVQVSNASISNFSGSGANYSFDLNVADGATASATVPANVAMDTTSNLNTASPETVSITRDSSAPSVSISTNAGGATNQPSVPVSVVFSEAVSGFTQSDIAVTNGTISNFSGSGANYTFDLNIADGATAIASVPANVAQDNANNSNAASPSNVSVLRDASAPSVTLATNAGSTTSDSYIVVSVTFSKNVTGFTADDVTVQNGSIANFSGSGDTYTFQLHAPDGGTATAQVAAGVAADAFGNGNLASSTSLSVARDSTAPTPVISASVQSHTDLTPFVATVTFSEPVSGFSDGELTASNASVGSLTTSDNKVFTAIVTPNSEQGVVLNVAAGVAQDSFGLANVAARALSVYGPTEQTAQLVSEFVENRTKHIVNNQPSIVGFVTGGNRGSGPVADIMVQGNSAAHNVFFTTSSTRVANSTSQGHGNAVGTQLADTKYKQSVVAQAFKKSEEDENVYLLKRPDEGEGLLSSSNALPKVKTRAGTWETWGELYGSRSQVGEATSIAWVGFLGAHYFWDDNNIVGIVGQFDWAEQFNKKSNYDSNGRGWMVGPYAAGKFKGHNLYYETSFRYGQSRNDVSPTGTYSDEFDTERFMATAKLSGAYKMSGFVIRPELSMSWYHENQEAYTDSLGNAIDDSLLSFGELRFGPSIEKSILGSDGFTYTPSFALKGVYNFDLSDRNAAQTGELDLEGWRARASIGLRVNDPRNGFTLTSEGFIDGLGIDDYHTIGGRIRLTVPF